VLTTELMKPLDLRVWGVSRCRATLVRYVLDMLLLSLQRGGGLLNTKRNGTQNAQHVDRKRKNKWYAA
jgi:hypothetical protein